MAVPLTGGAVAAAILWRRAAGRVEGRRWYGFVYRTMYLFRLPIWDRGVPDRDLVQLVEGDQHRPPGRALDIGCGTGTETIYLAEHGWEATGVDMVPRALSLARRKAAAAGVSPRFVEADATRLQDFGVGDGYDLLLDFGCFHTLPADQRDAYVESVSRAAAPGATFLLIGFTRPPRVAPMHAGLSTEEVRARFDGGRWELLGAERKATGPLEVAGRRADDLFELWGYRLRRSGGEAGEQVGSERA
ncbi:MAG: class I SAM-dependent methyltransferase [Candidatus Dormibacteraeota bacterium]|nr:class I SAM-dependent methyltransferase [Candidatus Dormibacteraeota bacterium]